MVRGTCTTAFASYDNIQYVRSHLVFKIRFVLFALEGQQINHEQTKETGNRSSTIT